MTRPVNNDVVQFDEEPEQHNNEIDLTEDGEDNFDFGGEISDEELTVKSVKNVLDSTTGSNGRNVKNVLDSTSASNGRNVTNSISFSTTKLAELDAKFQFSQNNVNRMDINEIMASVNLNGRSRFQKDAPTTSFKARKPSAVDSLLQPKRSDSFQRESFGNRQAFDNSIINEDPGKKFKETLTTARSIGNVVNKSQGKQTTMRTAQSTSTIASQNTSVASDQVISRSCFISVDKPVLAFGFVGYKTSRKLFVKISNDSSESLWLQPSITHPMTALNDNQSQETFRLTDQSSFSLDPHSTHDICVIFEPKKAVTYNAQLRLRLMSKSEPEFLIRMFGYGARAELELRSQSFDKIEMGSDGVGICEIDRSSKQTQLILTNKGQRDAFAHIIAVDANNQPISSSIISVEPNRVVVQKNTKEYVKINVNFRYGLSSTTMIKTRSTSQLSVASTHSTRTLHNESLARLQIVWGEERLRRRLKCYLNNNTDENVPISLMDYVTSNFRGESEFKTEKIVGRWDLTRFSDSSRIMTVQFIDLRVRPQNSAATLSRPPSSASIRTPPNQTLANTMAPSQTSHQYSMFSNATVDDDTMPINPQRKSRYR